MHAKINAPENIFVRIIFAIHQLFVRVVNVTFIVAQVLKNNSRVRFDQTRMKVQNIQSVRFAIDVVVDFVEKILNRRVVIFDIDILVQKQNRIVISVFDVVINRCFIIARKRMNIRSIFASFDVNSVKNFVRVRSPELHETICEIRVADVDDFF